LIKRGALLARGKRFEEDLIETLDAAPNFPVRGQFGNPGWYRVYAYPDFDFELSAVI